MQERIKKGTKRERETKSGPVRINTVGFTVAKKRRKHGGWVRTVLGGGVRLEGNSHEKRVT